MENYPSVTNTRTADVVRTFMARSYSWMAAGLALTAGVAFMTAQNMGLAIQVAQLYLPLVLLQLGLVFVLSAFAARLNSVVAGALFIAYAALTGLTFSSIFLRYDMSAVTAAFATAAGTFGAMSVAGFVIKRDLSSLGRFFMFALIGLLVAMIVNLFVASGPFSLVISIVGVLLFAGLTVYDTQKLKQLALAGLQGEIAERAAISGALTLYLDFINLFLFLLRIFGGGRR